ncbi:unnamed protein product [Clonostachys rhizophaga]|uniref:Zn(2)-C6 fungal-type domain-containing protein n=1 Tax=Clonostachys rhizophaga TaxID=160324 RepID=A0A9N9VRF0_9HYPO|nr:unnamed protein product [Clonostachys rhizophaga]
MGSGNDLPSTHLLQCDLQRLTCGQCQRGKLTCGDMSERSFGQPKGCPEESLTRSAYQERYLGLFWDIYLPNGRKFPAGSAQHTTELWLNHVQKLVHEDNQIAIRMILLAISLANVGLYDNKTCLVESGTRMYGSCLSTLAEEIGSNTRSTPSSLLATSRLCSLYEVVQHPVPVLYGHDYNDRLAQARTWQLHTGGESEVVPSRVTEQLASRFAYQLSIDGRSTQISTLIISRTPSALNKPNWKMDLWKRIARTPKDLLGDIFAEIPDLLSLLISSSHPIPVKKKGGKAKIPDQKVPSANSRMVGLGAGSGSKIKSTYLRHDTNGPDLQPPGLCTQHERVLEHWHLPVCHLPVRFRPASSKPLQARRLDQGLVEENFGDNTYVLASASRCFWTLRGFLDETDNGLLSPEARVFYYLFDRNEKGQIVENFVENMRRHLSARGQRMFPMDID